MPPHDRGRPDDVHRVSPGRPELPKQHPEQPVRAAQTRYLRRIALEDRQLMAQGEHLDLEFDATAETGAKGRDDRNGYRVSGSDTGSCGPEY